LLYMLPEECISSVMSFTSPPDACRSSSVSTSFRSVAESDAVWGSFLPPQYQSIISRSADSSSLAFSSKKELYLRLCDHPLLIDDGRKVCICIYIRRLQRFVVSLCPHLTVPLTFNPELFVGEEEWKDMLHAISKGPRHCLDGSSLLLETDLFTRSQVSLSVSFFFFFPNRFCGFLIDFIHMQKTGSRRWRSFSVFVGWKSVERLILARCLQPRCIHLILCSR